MIADKLAQVHSRIASACAAAGRPVQSVTLLAVSKTFGVDRVAEAHAAGQRRFGENYVQEAILKVAALEGLVPRPEWHLIGPIQSNKTRVVAATFDWVHSVDRLKVAERLSAQRPAGLAPLSVCIQVNVVPFLIPLANCVSQYRRTFIRLVCVYIRFHAFFVQYFYHIGMWRTIRTSYAKINNLSPLLIEVIYFSQFF